jgi:hypothetical protein
MKAPMTSGDVSDIAKMPVDSYQPGAALSFLTLAGAWLRKLFITKAQNDAAVDAFIARLVADNPDQRQEFYHQRARGQFPLHAYYDLHDRIHQEVMRAFHARHVAAARKFIRSAMMEGGGASFDALYRVRAVIEQFADSAGTNSPLEQDELTRIAAEELISRIEKDILHKPVFLKF